MNRNIEARNAISSAKRIVVKIGSRVLVQRNGRPDLQRMQGLVRDLAWLLQKEEREIVVVTSGAIGAGVAALGMARRPTSLPDLQMAAAVGQTRLMAHYDRLFSARRCRVGQVLLTHDDLKNRRRHLNARNTMMNLLRNRIVPIVNENDVVSVNEIKFGDNDLLGALVSLLIEADLLILLTTVDGFRAPSGSRRTRRIPLLTGVTEEELALAIGKGSNLSTGGMASKLQSADMAARVGVPVIIADGRKPGVLRAAAHGEDVGTLIFAGTSIRSEIDARKRWIAFFHKAQGVLIVDDGCREAIEQRGRSLLPIGIKDVEGRFDSGDVVNVRTAGGVLFARGVVDYSSTDIARIKGRRTSEIEGILGSMDYEEVIHRDNMVVITNGGLK